MKRKRVKNPRGDNDLSHVIAVLHDLLLSPEVGTFEAAQDWLLENEVSLPVVSKVMSTGTWTGWQWLPSESAFDYEKISEGTFEVTRGEEVNGRWPHAEGVAWYVAQTSGTELRGGADPKYFVHVAIHVIGHLPSFSRPIDQRQAQVIVPASGGTGRFSSFQEARDIAVTTAWHAVKMMKENRLQPFVKLQAMMLAALRTNPLALSQFPLPRALLGDENQTLDHPTYIQNPPWVTHALADAFEALAAQVKPEWMPKLADVRGGPKGTLVAKLNEYGCGAYGCVLPTHDPGVVLKVTTDDTEAEFASSLAAEVESPICVEYLQVADLPAQHDGRPIHLLWREAADDVGELQEVISASAGKAVAAQHEAAKALYLMIHQGDVVGAAFDGALASWKRAAQAMGEASAELAPLATGMLNTLERQGIFFGDIHEGNLGRVWRGQERAQWVITDPGHVAVLPPDLVR